MSDFLLSIVIPVYQEERQIENSIDVIFNIMKKNKYLFELILVDDGSLDQTWSVIEKLSKVYTFIHGIRLSRNFGKEAALCAGLEAVNGDACIVMDADLQHPPEMIPEMVAKWQEGYEVIECVKEDRGKEKFINKVGAKIFYGVLSKLSGFDLNRASDYKLLDSKVLAAWSKMKERTTFFRGMSTWVGFKRISIPFVVAERKIGSSKWSILNLSRLAVTAIIAFSSAPLYIVTTLGIVFLIGAFILGIQTLFMKFAGTAVSGFTTVILLLLIIGSAVMINLGIIGIYISKIYIEVKGRPRYIIGETIKINIKDKD